MIAQVEALAADERGAALGMLTAGAGGAAARALVGGAGVRCRAALEALAALPEAARTAERDALAAWLAAPVPEGVAAVHPGWLRRVLERESSALVRVLARGLPREVAQVADEVLGARGEVLGSGPDGPGASAARRAAFASLAPMPTSGGPPLARALCALPGAALLDEIERRGAETLGRALAGAPDAVIARAAAGVGMPLARVVLATAKAGADAEARAEARALAAAPPADGAVGVARAVGMRALARALGAEGEGALLAVAQRLPPAVGEALLACAEEA